MSKVVFFCIPAYGHTNPTLSVVSELIRRKHEVWYYSYEQFRTVIEETGAKFISCNQYDPQMELSAKDGARISTDLAFSTKLLVNMTLSMDAELIEELQAFQPDVMVCDSMALWGKCIAKKLNLPFISSTTTFAFNRYSAKIMKQSVSELFKLLFSLPSINKDLKRLRDRGYPIKNILSLIQNDNTTNTIVYTSKEFQPCAETFADCYRFVGPSIRQSTEKITQTDKPLIYISLGTVMNLNNQFYQNCIEAFRTSPYRVLLSVGEATDVSLLHDIPEHITVTNKVDQIAVLQSAAVFLTHCGMNSVNEGLYFAVPLVLFPQTTEQRGVAMRVAQLNAGAYLNTDDPQTIRTTVEAVMHNPLYRENAQKIAASFKACGKAKEAVNFIEEIAEKSL